MEDSNSLHTWNEADKPREKLLRYGVEHLTETEIIAILLRVGVKGKNVVELAKDILNYTGNDLDKLARMTVPELMQAFKGMGEAKAITLVAALELGRRRKTQQVKQVKKVTSSTDIAEYFNWLADLDHEEFHVLIMNQAHRIIESHKISEGGFSATVVDMKKLFKYLLLHSAVAIAVCHNHPSENTYPSKQDCDLTSKLVELCRFHDIQMLDHIIIGGRNYYSFADEGRI